MMTPRENAMAIYNRQQPDRYFDLMDAIQLVPDPVLMSGMVPQDGLEHKDPWGTVYIYKPEAPGPHPHVTAENAVIKDITHWQGLPGGAACQRAGLVRGQTGGRRHGQGRKICGRYVWRRPV